MKEFVFNPLHDKSIIGACKKGEEITYRLKVKKHLGFVKAFFVMHKDGKQDKFFEMIKDFIDERFVYLSIKLKFSETGHFWYHFEVDTLTRHYVLGSGENLDLAPVDEESNYLQLVYEKDSKIDKSFHKGIIYHIFVDRFNRKGKVVARPGLKLVDSWEENVDKEFNEKKERVNVKCYGGNFEGIISKLDYLSSLNVKTLYLSPIFEANSSHKYDVADYQKIDSMFGGEKKFKELVDKAKEKGINIIIDGVFNHTGSDSVYFNKEGRYKNIGAYQSQKSKYYPWYEFYEYPDSYSAWWGVKTLPQTREDSSFFDFISGRGGIIEKYMSMGIMGFRLDVVDELSNKFLYAICSRARRVKNNCMMLGEVWEDASCKLSYGERKNYFLGWYLDSVTNYPMKNAILHFVKFGNEKEFVDTINMILDRYPKEIQNNLMNIIDTHDTARALTYLGVENIENVDLNDEYTLTKEERKNGVKLLKLATIMQYTVMGIPTVFYGDEAGLQGTKDPYCRAPYPWGQEDKELLTWYTKLGTLRKKQVFDGGSFDLLYANNGVISYKREKGNNKLIVVINRSKETFEFTITTPMKDYFTSKKIEGKTSLSCDEFLVLVG